MKSYNQLLEYFNKNYKNFIFIAAFYSLWLVHKYVASFDPELQNFSGRMISEATLQGYDISKRVAIFYQAGAIFLLCLLIFSIIVSKISFLKELLKSPEIRIINYSSIAGSILYFFSVWGSTIHSSLTLIFCIHLVALSGLFLKKIFLKNSENASLIDISFYSISLAIGFSIFFLWNECAVLLHVLPKVKLSLVLFIAAIIVCFLTTRLIKNKTFIESRNEINRFAFLLFPLTFIPLLSVLKDEIYLILNRHQVYYLSPRKLYFAGIALLLIYSYWRSRIIKKNPLITLTKNTSQLVAKNYFPLLVLGISAFTFYTPFIPFSSEMFEAGNQYLPLMEFQKFGVVPIIEKFNSHELYELFFNGIYTFFNGLNSTEIGIYGFIYQTICSIIVYYLFYKLSRNAFISLFMVFLFPLIEIVLPYFHSFALIAIFVLDITINQKASLKNYLLLFSWTLFLILWRIDIGYPALIATMGVLFIYWLNQKRFVFDIRLLIKSILILSGSIALILAFIAYSRNINVFHKMYNAFNYLASAQTYGHVDYGDQTSSAFKMQYFIFPILIIILIGALMVSFQKYTISKMQRFAYTTFFFLTIYYVVNFQRGLVRHSFTEGHDAGVSSYSFFILSAIVYLFYNKKTQVFKFLVFIVISAFLMIGYKYPAIVDPQNLYSATIDKTDHFPVITPQENIKRSVDTSDFENKHFGELKKLISEKLNTEQTFIDFSNNPMLYYFTGKISPSYFYQNPLTIHNDYLQKNFIEELKNYDAPLIIFSKFPESFWDNVDGVPNELRHYRMMEYFCNNYQPFTIMNDLCVWKRNDFKLENNEQLKFSYTLPAKDSLNKNNWITGTIKSNSEKKYLFKLKTYVLKNDPSLEITVNDNTTIKPDYIDKDKHLFYYIFNTSKSEFAFKIKNEEKNITQFNILEYDYIPDFYSDKTKDFDLNKLAYIWGTYDKNIESEKVIGKLISEKTTLVKGINYFKLPEQIDRTTGNTILLNVDCTNTENIIFELLYGSSKNGYKGNFKFVLPPGKGPRTLAIRISTQYNWYDDMNDYIGIHTQNQEEIIINKLDLLKGE